MKTILYIGDFVQFFATENYITYGFEQLGYAVMRVNEKSVPNAKAVLGAALKYKVEFVMFSKGKFVERDETVALLQKYNILTVGWIFDLFFTMPALFGRSRLTSAAFKADICCLTDGGHKTEWKSHNVNHRLLRQGIHKPDAKLGKKRPHEPIIFLGTYSYAARMELIDWLKKTYGKDFAHYGKGGDRPEVRGMELNDLLASTKIVVGDSVPSPNYWSNRIYEVTGRGGFLLHPSVEGLETEFKDGQHYIGYQHGNFTELKKKIDYYLTHDQEREKIKMAGHNLTKTTYAYTNRCQQLIKYVEEYKQSKSHAAVLE